MIVESTGINGLYLIKHEKNYDERGSFERIYCKNEFLRLGLMADYPQLSISSNKKKGTLRGMHYQKHPNEEVKLVTCLSGKIYDVVIDVRPNSPTFADWHAEILSFGDGKSLYVPKGCAHGFLTLVDESVVLYQISAAYDANSAVGVRWDDPAFTINWPLRPAVISERDRNFPYVCLARRESLFN